ncbi:hypothetical protein P8T11_20620 [Achromobacter spanius]|uniref:Uncharacterized protein n=1 Tax=Achromobacter spanius TaxID=217203 RepID=A0ABY8H3A2_9BURK|nr:MULTISPECIES: hypothetical protein [Achromobacter]WAI86266.1 hypothetical protein N8Z00_02880 [Achromobacter spanius]WEX97520.1 hypothetical protein N3Z32_26640 [Achromobacter sp. SS2-2022]WFP11178.1 hypothetical protein P8T11_20620 [Achromobacter spanius]
MVGLRPSPGRVPPSWASARARPS